MKHLVTGDECVEGTQKVPKTFKSCCETFERRTKACQYEFRIEWYGRGKWGTPIPHDGSYLCIKYCPFCGKKL